MQTLLARDDRPPRRPAPRLALAPDPDGGWTGWTRRGPDARWVPVVHAESPAECWSYLLAHDDRGAKHSEKVVLPYSQDPNHRRTSR